MKIIIDVVKTKEGNQVRLVVSNDLTPRQTLELLSDMIPVAAAKLIQDMEQKENGPSVQIPSAAMTEKILSPV